MSTSFRDHGRENNNRPDAATHPGGYAVKQTEDKANETDLKATTYKVNPVDMVIILQFT